MNPSRDTTGRTRSRYVRCRWGGAVVTMALLVPGCVSNRFTRAVEQADHAADAAAHNTAKRTGPATNTGIDDDGDEPVSVLTVNGREVTVDEVIEPIRADLQKHARRSPPVEYRDYLVETVNRRIASLVRDTLLFHEAAKDLTEQEEQHINGLVDQEVRKRVNLDFAGRQTRYEQELTDKGSSLADERERIRRQLIIMRWLQLTVYRKIADPTRDELMRLFASQREAFTRPPRRDMLIIEIPVEAESSAPADETEGSPASSDRQRARQRAEAARAELLGGAAFGDVARTYSTGWHRQTGGRWGWVTRGSVRERLEPAVEALFALPETGVPSAVIETPESFFIVQAAAIDPGEEPDFAAVQPQLVAGFRESQFNRIVDELVQRLHEEALFRPKNVNRFVHAALLAAPKPEFTPSLSQRPNP